MVWTTPKSWLVGELVTAANMNLHVRDNMNFLYNVPRYRAYRTTALSVTSATNINMSCDSQIYDIGALFAPTSHSFTTNVTGLWTVMCGYQLDTFIGGGVQACWLTDGTNLIVEQMWQRNATNDEQQSLACHGQAVLSASVTVSAIAWQNSGSARNTSVIARIGCWHAGSWKGA